VAAARDNRIRVAVGPSARFLPWFAAAKKALDAGRIGTPFSLRIAHHHGTLDVFHADDFYRDPAEGGPELSLGWYMVDLVLHFMQKPVERIAANYGTFTTPGGPFMDCGKLSLGMAGGAMASCDLYFCNRFAFPAWEMELVGDRGALLVRQSGGAGQETSVVLLTAAGRKNISPPARTPHWELFWVDELRGRGAPSVSAEYAREVTRICLAARDSARRGKTVTLGRGPAAG
jgi:predicted dehydrogenase